jgi:F-type H+-transporting ATPase subunit epsilon
MTYQLRVRTPDKTFFDAEVVGIVCPGLGGYFGVLSGHLPLISGLGVGVLKVETEVATVRFVIDGGMAEVKGREVDIFSNAVFPVDSVVAAEEKMGELQSKHQSQASIT